MSTYRVTATRRVAAPARIAYDLIADYRTGHTQIVPPKVFQNLQVEAGGYGEGTKITFDVRAFGSTTNIRADITEPKPGRVLVETETDHKVVTTFSVEPIGDGSTCDVTIDSIFKSRDGVLGKIEQSLAKPFLRRVYKDELQRLEAIAKQVSSRTSGPAAA